MQIKTFEESLTDKVLKREFSNYQSFPRQIDKYLIGLFPSSSFFFLKMTSKALLDLEIKNNPILLKQGKLKKIMSFNKADDRFHFFCHLK